MALNDVMLRVAKQHIDKQPRGMQFSRFQLDRILEALRISVKVQKSKLRPLKRDRESEKIATIGNQINDDNQLIVLFRQEVERLKKESESCPPTNQA